MVQLFKLTPTQWKTFSSGLSNISQGIILFSLAAFFVPKAVNLDEDFSKQFATLSFIGGLLLFIVSIIISGKGNHDR